LIRIVRWNAWASSKLPPLLTLSFLWILHRDPPPGDAMMRIAELLIFAVLGFSFGYLVNDYSDRSSDRLAGKFNALEILSGKRAFALLIALAAAGVAVLMSARAGLGLLTVGVLSYVAALSYSAGPRLKERGALGVLTSALAQRTIPALFTLVLFQDIRAETLVLTLVYTIVGLRWILMHQAIDCERDRRSQVRTFVSDRDPRLARKLIQRVLFPLELFGLSVWFVMAVPQLPGLAPMAAIYLAWFLLRRRVLHDDAYSWMSYSNVYLGDLYAFWLPVSLGIMCAALQPLYWILVILAVGLAYRRLARELSILHAARRQLH